jgi:hypothetical protein
VLWVVHDLHGGIVICLPGRVLLPCSCCTEAAAISTEVFPDSLVHTVAYDPQDPAPPGVQTLEATPYTYVNTKGPQVATWCKFLIDASSGSGHGVLGLDAEWNASLVSGVSPGHIATLQIAADGQCVIFHLTHLHTDKKLPQPLIDLLGNSSITFVGNNIKGDITRLRNQYKVTVAIKSRDLGEYFNTMYPLESTSHWSLQVSCSPKPCNLRYRGLMTISAIVLTLPTKLTLGA